MKKPKRHPYAHIQDITKMPVWLRERIDAEHARQIAEVAALPWGWRKHAS